MPPIIGNIWRPDAVGLTPFTTWRKSGRYVTDPKSAKPTIRPTAEVMVNVRFANKRRGNTGSVARRSTNTKATSEITAAAISKSIIGDINGRNVPLTSDTRTMALSESARSVVPA